MIQEGWFLEMLMVFSILELTRPSCLPVLASKIHERIQASMKLMFHIKMFCNGLKLLNVVV